MTLLGKEMSPPRSERTAWRVADAGGDCLAPVASSRESRNALADRLLGEAVGVERHPFIQFHAGTAGRRQPRVVGTRLAVHQLVATVRANALGASAPGAGLRLGLDNHYAPLIPSGSEKPATTPSPPLSVGGARGRRGPPRHLRRRRPALLTNDVANFTAISRRWARRRPRPLRPLLHLRRQHAPKPPNHRSLRRWFESTGVVYDEMSAAPGR